MKNACEICGEVVVVGAVAQCGHRVQLCPRCKKECPHALRECTECENIVRRDDEEFTQ